MTEIINIEGNVKSKEEDSNKKFYKYIIEKEGKEQTYRAFYHDNEEQNKLGCVATGEYIKGTVQTKVSQGRTFYNLLTIGKSTAPETKEVNLSPNPGVPKPFIPEDRIKRIEGYAILKCASMLVKSSFAETGAQDTPSAKRVIEYAKELKVEFDKWMDEK